MRRFGSVLRILFLFSCLAALGVEPSHLQLSAVASGTHAATPTFNWGSFNYLKLFGQSDPSQATHNTASAYGIYHGGGVVVDRSSTPNRSYVVDPGNNRILGYNGMPKGDGTDTPTLVFGQPDVAHSACNHDDNVGLMGAASATRSAYSVTQIS